MPVVRYMLLVAIFIGSSVSFATELPRRDGAVDESYPEIEVDYGSLQVEGARLRTILSRPSGVDRPPVILFVQWLSCDSVELDPQRNDGWSQMLRGMVVRSGWAVMRTDKRGVGDSEGDPCGQLDYDTELDHHRRALAALVRRADVDAGRIVVFGASMGSRMAPQVAAGHPSVVGILTWGGGSKTWFERMQAFDRNAMERGGTSAGEIAPRMRAQSDFYAEYLLAGRNPPDIIASQPEMARVWSEIIGTSPNDHYGRPFAFHHQAQAANWVGAWGEIDVPVLVVMGEYDWFENRAGHETVARIVNRRRAGLAQFVVIPEMDHHFSLFGSAEAAFEDTTGRADAEPFLALAFEWLSGLPE